MIRVNQLSSEHSRSRRTAGLLLAAGALAFCLLLLMGLSVSAEGPANAPAAAPTKKPIVPGLYYFENHTHLAGAYTDPQMTGSQLEVMWDQVNGQGEGIYDWRVIDNWVAQEKAHGNKWVLRVLIYQNRAASGIPAWVEDRMNPGFWSFTNWAFPLGLKLPNYRDKALQDALRTFTRDLGERYDDDPDLVLVQIALGLYGEMHPERNDEFGNLKDWYYGTDNQYGRRLPPCDWIDFVTTTIDSYVSGFPTTPLVIMQSPSYGYKCDRWYATEPYHEEYWERPTVEQFALDRGVGFQNNSLDEWDANWFTCGATGTTGPYTVDGSVQNMVDNWRNIPVVFERGSWLSPYNKYFAKDYYQTWWSYLNALDKHADMIFPPNWDGEIWYDNHVHTFPSGVWRYDSESPGIPYADELRWMNQFALDHLGKDEATTPDVWTVLFDTPTDNCTAQHTDHQFFLYRIDTYNGHDIPNAGTVFEQDVYTKSPYFEGKYTRRTDQVRNQHLMYFNIDDGYHFAADPAWSTWTVDLWYLNNGDDTIRFEYTDHAGQQQVYTIQKPGGETGWVQTSFRLEDAYFANNVGYGADFRLNSAHDGPDEYIHMVKLSCEEQDPPTATPTHTPVPPTSTPVPPTATATVTTDDPTPDVTETPAPTQTPTTDVTTTATAGSTDVTEPTATPTPTGTTVAGVTGTATVAVSGTPTATTVVTGTVTGTPTATGTSTITQTPTATATWRPSATVTGTQPPTSTVTHTATVTPTSIQTVNANSTTQVTVTATQSSGDATDAGTPTLTATPPPTLEPVGTLPGVPIASVISGTPVVLTPTPTAVLPLLVPATWTPAPSPTATPMPGTTGTPDESGEPGASVTPSPTTSDASITLTLGSIPCAPAIGLQVLLLGGALMWVMRSAESSPEGNAAGENGQANAEDEDD